MVFSLAPNISKSGSAKDSNSTVSTSAVITSIVRQFPMMRSDFSLSPAPSGDRGARRAADGHERRERRDNHDDRQAYANARQREFSDGLGGLHVADEHAVDQIVEHVDDLRGDRRHGERKEQLFDVPVSQICALIQNHHLNFSYFSV